MLTWGAKLTRSILTGKLSLYMKIEDLNNIINKHMSKLEGIYGKVVSLCQFINAGRNQLKVSHLAEKCRALRLPTSAFYSKQRYIYNLALAAITTIIEFPEGFQMATILLRKICPDTSYWDLLHLLHDLRNDVIEILKSSDQVVEKLPIKAIFVGQDLNRIYQCHCALLSQLDTSEHQRSTLPSPSANLPKGCQQVIELVETQGLSEVAGDRKQDDSCSDSCIDVDAIFLEVSDEESDSSHSRRQQKSQDEFDIMIEDQDPAYNDSINIIENQNISEQLRDKKLQNAGISVLSKFDSLSEIKSAKHSRCAANQSAIREPSSSCPRALSDSKADLERCEICLALYHPTCQVKQQFMCDKCYLKQSSLKYRVIKDFYCGHTATQFALTLIQFQCPDADGAKTKYSQTFIVELRLKVFSPDRTASKLVHPPGVKNNKKKAPKTKLNFYLNCQPMKLKSYLQLDEIVTVKIPLKYLEIRNTLIIQNSNQKASLKPADGNEIVLVGVYQVVPRSRKKELINNSILKLPERSLRLFYNSVLARLGVPRLNFSLLSGVSKRRMQSPVRSLQCQHLECFDYSEALQSQKRGEHRAKKQTSASKQANISKSTSSYWRLGNKTGNVGKIYCPICHIQMKSLYLDQLVLNEIEKMNKNKQSLSFYLMKVSVEQVERFTAAVGSPQPKPIESQMQSNRHCQNEQNVSILISEYSYNTKPNITFSDSEMSESSSSSIEQIDVIEIPKRKLIKKHSKALSGESRAGKCKNTDAFDDQAMESVQQLDDQLFFNKFRDIQQMMPS